MYRAFMRLSVPIFVAACGVCIFKSTADLSLALAACSALAALVSAIECRTNAR